MKLKANLKSASFKPKSVQLNKAQSRLLSIVVGATVVTVFCLTSAKVLLNQAMYQQRVISARNASVKQLNDNVKNASALSAQYKSVFLGSDGENIIGGSSVPGGNPSGKDGDNGKIVLDALPTTYDFPALLTSLSKLLGTDGVGAQSIGGSDQAVSINSSPTYSPQPQPINLTVSGASTYTGSKQLIKDLERSIRPFDVTHLTLAGNESNMLVTMDLTTYYQPAKTLSIPSKEIK
jgi:hypothetical protein